MSVNAYDYNHISANGSIPLSLLNPPRTASMLGMSNLYLADSSEDNADIFPNLILSRLLRVDDAYEEHNAKLVSALAPTIVEGVCRSLISSGWASAGTKA